MAQVQERDFDRRPDPDALLALASGEAHGRLRIFLGAAPGVGKTYAMLSRARAVKAEGVDVVIGLVETHGRAETQALAEGLEVLPRRIVDYHGHKIEEFDIDAALKRKPKLIVVDELAHTNPPDSRHPKRWQDIEELLDAGVDVWTALNIQHLESLADVVARITGVRVRETVPDRVLSDASDVVLVDITPDELIQRLKEGKVYFAQTAAIAAQNFFTPGNLTALRELALRRTADRVDDQMVDYLRQNAIEGPWATNERLLVCVGADVSSEAVVRAAARLATGLNAEWTAVFVERPGQEETDLARVKRVDDALRLAERLGAATERLSAEDLVGALLDYARRENFTQIVLGRSRAARLPRLMRHSLTQELVRRSRDVAVHVVTDAGEAPPTRKLEWPTAWSLIGSFGAAVASVGATVGAGFLLDHWLHLQNLSMIFLVAVIFCALRFGLVSATAAAVLSFLAFDFFFVEPRFRFEILEPQEFLALLVFLVVAIITGMLAGRVREHSLHLTQRIDAARALFEFSRKLSAAANLDEVAWVAAAQTQKAIAARAVVILAPQEGELQLAAAWPPIDSLEVTDMSAARWSHEKSENSGWRTGTLPNARFHFRPLMTPRGCVGVCGVEPRARDAPFSPQEERLLSSILDQTATAIDRAGLVEHSIRAAALEENEKLRQTLLSSLSHDLRTPLASITGAVTSLRELGEKMSPPERQDLLASIEEESGRLSRFVKNLLDMSRIEAGALEVRRDWVDVADAVRAAAGRIKKTFPEMKVSLSLAPGLPFIRGDANLLQQVLFNLLDNAHKYGGGAAAVHARREGRDVVVTVTDEGPGIKPADLERIFEKFYRGGRPDGRKAGTGLGLSICRGLVEAMGGTIRAQSPALRRRGTRIILRFPAAEGAKEGTAR
ncbi:MAG TPA: sensor histidine kinase KdpD [Methylocystis sp.]|nr:sensor histidine kinase KdpD [Methylocystis sp.]